MHRSTVVSCIGYMSLIEDFAVMPSCSCEEQVISLDDSDLLYDLLAFQRLLNVFRSPQFTSPSPRKMNKVPCSLSFFTNVRFDHWNRYEVPRSDQKANCSV